MLDLKSLSRGLFAFLVERAGSGAYSSSPSSDTNDDDSLNEGEEGVLSCERAIGRILRFRLLVAAVEDGGAMIVRFEKVEIAFG